MMKTYELPKSQTFKLTSHETWWKIIFNHWATFPDEKQRTSTGSAPRLARPEGHIKLATPGGAMRWALKAEWFWMLGDFSMLSSWPTSTRDYAWLFYAVWGLLRPRVFEPHGYAQKRSAPWHPGHAMRINEAQIWSFLVAKCVGPMWKPMQIESNRPSPTSPTKVPQPRPGTRLVLLSLACS